MCDAGSSFSECISESSQFAIGLQDFFHSSALEFLKSAEQRVDTQLDKSDARKVAHSLKTGAPIGNADLALWSQDPGCLALPSLSRSSMATATAGAELLCMVSVALAAFELEVASANEARFSHLTSHQPPPSDFQLLFHPLLRRAIRPAHLG